MPNFAAKEASGAAIPGQYAVSTRFNPHLSNQADMLLGHGGGTVTGSASAHYNMTIDSCVTCHLGASDNHNFVADVSTCVVCHDGAENSDINGAVSER
ncbi:MAG: hypothetical protein FJZ96_07320 [Chloroflexi bacterium]|nr:hypothetical protein [Chloroflexota bacterium]